MSCYLIKPTRKQIKEACLWLLETRNDKYDNQILNRFFQFKNGENRFHAIDRSKGDKFKPIVNFLTGETKSTTTANLELIAWLIDFKPRPLSMYLKTPPIVKRSVENKMQMDTNASSPPLLIENHLVPSNQVIQKDDKSITISWMKSKAISACLC